MRPLLKTVKHCIKNGETLKLQLSCEGIFYVKYGTHPIYNGNDRREAEYLYELARTGYDWHRGFKNVLPDDLDT